MSENIYEELLKCSKDFTYWVKNYVKIEHPKKGLIPLELYPFQEKVIKDYENYQYNILIKFRQGGFTTFTVIYGLWKCMFHLDQRIMFLSRSDREACHMSRIVKRVLDWLPEWMAPKMIKDTEHVKEFTDTGSSLNFFSVGAMKARGCTLLVFDEAAFINKMDEHWKAMYPVLSTGGSCIVLSTVNGVGNWFEKTWHAAEEGKNNFHTIKIDYTEHPEYNKPEWVEMIKKNLGVKGFMQEVEGKFFPDEDVEMNKATVKLIQSLDNKELSYRVKATTNFFAKSNRWEDLIVLYEAANRLESME